MLPIYCCWCRFYTTVRVDAAQIFVVGVGVMLPILPVSYTHLTLPTILLV